MLSSSHGYVQIKLISRVEAFVGVPLDVGNVQFATVVFQIYEGVVSQFH